MLGDSFRKATDTAVASRFELRDKTLIQELDDLVAKSSTYADPTEREKLGVKLRLICERDLFDRAHMVWVSVKRAHEATGEGRSPTLVKELIEEMHRHMKDASLHLARELSQRADDLASAMAGFSGLSADWIANLRARAVERFAREADEYVSGLRRSFF